ncbi:ComF family protein [Nitratifractor sp.]
MDVISLFRYKTIAPFLLSKHTSAGYRLYRYFSRRHLAPFLELFAEGLERPAFLIGIDERIKGGYSHTAVLTHYARQSALRPLHASLQARNPVSYAGKSLEYRLLHPRDFRYDGPSGIEAILVDDIITTGSTLGEAHRVLKETGVEVLFALTLADARE